MITVHNTDVATFTNVADRQLPHSCQTAVISTDVYKRIPVCRSADCTAEIGNYVIIITTIMLMMMLCIIVPWFIIPILTHIHIHA